MNKLGEHLKEKRQEIGISIEEVAHDLNIDKIIIENLEEGNDRIFKDVLNLKETTGIYAKYLGLDEKEINDILNNFLYNKTSRISLTDIEETLKNQEDAKPKEVGSPYSLEIPKKNKTGKIVILVVSILLILLIFLVFKLYL